MITTIGHIPVHVEETPESAQKRAAARLSEFLGSCAYTETPVLFLTAGGSALAILEYMRRDVFGSHITASVLDERYDESHEENTFARAMHTRTFTDIADHGGTFIDTRVQKGMQPNDLRDTFAHELAAWVEAHPHGIIIATIGVGSNGHIAGIMPDHENPDAFAARFENTDQWMVAYDTHRTDTPPWRITPTFPFLQMIDYGMVYAHGSEKGEAFHSLVSQTRPYHEQPAQFIRTLPRGECFIDAALAQSANMA